jgi:tetratricopeptide (TPR) repeat protein
MSSMSGSSEEQIRAALAAFERGRLLQARSLLQACAEGDDPDYATRAKAMLADLAFAQGDLPAAERLAREAMGEGVGEGTVAATMVLGSVLVARGDDEGAARVYGEMMEAGPPATAALAAFNLGVMRGEAGDVDAAKAAYAVAIEGGDREVAPRAEVNLGILLATAGDLPGATAALESAASRDNPEQTAKARLNLLVLRRRYADPEPPPSGLNPAERLHRIAELQAQSAALLLASARSRDPIQQLDLYVSLLERVDQISTMAETPDEAARAVDACRGAVRIGEMLVKRFPYEPSHLALGMNAAGRLGDLHAQRRAVKDARKWYGRAHKAAAKLSRTNPGSSGPLAAARSCWQLATVDPGRAHALMEESASWLAMATERGPDNPELPYERSLLLWRRGTLDPAVAEESAAQIITDLTSWKGRLPPEAAKALTWARANVG